MRFRRIGSGWGYGDPGSRICGFWRECDAKLGIVGPLFGPLFCSLQPDFGGLSGKAGLYHAVKPERPTTRAQRIV